MSEPSDRLVAAEIQAELKESGIGHAIALVEETGSTNDLAWEAFERGAGQGFVVFAERQTKGRGQRGRRWESAPYLGLWFSLVLQPEMTLRESPQLTAILAKAVSAAITSETGCVTRIKEPNDIYIGERKVAGILVEGRTARDGTYVAVAGIGINVNQTRDDFPEELRKTAGSLAMATGRKISRTKLAVAILAQLENVTKACHPEQSRGIP